ncbi:MAG: DNA repair protein RecN [Gammaproteobacteria bacterium]|nr:DNA repair protein RecN [Gammaproteobacteria bacterium]
MLTHIHIWNFAIVEKLDLALETGLTVLTGETGAGKSILLNALGLALGDRADSDVVRHGADKAEVSVSFYTGNNPAAEAWLREHELDSADECIIRRTISANGPSKAFINGKPSPISQLRELGEMLVDLHGQHEHQSLMKRSSQAELVDAFIGDTKLLQGVVSAYREWKQVNEEFQRLSRASAERDARLDLLRFQVQELEALNLANGETEQLEHEDKRLANINQLVTTSERVMHRLQESDEYSVSHTLSQCLSELQDLQAVDEDLKATTEMLDSATIQLNETISELRHYINNLETDPARLSEVEERLNEVHTLARKHHVQAEELVSLLPTLQAELAELEDADIRLEKMQQTISAAAERYRQQAQQLSQARQQAATHLSKQVTAAMQELSMAGGKFEVRLETLPEDEFSPQGQERAEFLVSANPGQPLKPLTKVASGGEISRISLAIQVCATEAALIPTLVFDEVDVGIGGRVAEIVGQKLRTLGNRRQVLCVTHLPQVAALGHHHFQVSKQIDQALTITRIQSLKTEQRVDELARMLGGLEITEQTLSHAREMIERAQA